MNAATECATANRATALIRIIFTLTASCYRRVWCDGLNVTRSTVWVLGGGGRDRECMVNIFTKVTAVFMLIFVRFSA